MTWLAASFGIAGGSALLLFLWRLADIRAERAVWSSLLRRGGTSTATFSLGAIESLPQAAQRYFRFTIAPGTPLVSLVEIEMEGQLGLGTKDAPGYRAMHARQILAPPTGLLWKLRAGAISGSDAVTADISWTRFWLFNLLPIVRVSGNPDHHRSAFGRVVAEGAFWAPASLLPSDHVVWQEVDRDTARAIVSDGALSQAIDLTIEPDGRPSRIVIQRWSNANPDKVYREQAFGGYLSDFQDVEGYRLPMHVEGGNFIGTEDYFPFYKAIVREIRFPQLAESSTGRDSVENEHGKL